MRLGGLFVALLMGCGERWSPPQPFFAPVGEPLPTLTEAQRQRFERGRELATRVFVPSEGLGPLLSSVTCGGCHAKPVFGGGSARYRNTFVRVGAGTERILPFEPQLTLDGAAFPKSGVSMHDRNAPAFFGIGLLAEIPFEAISPKVDPNDSDGDGISGRVNFERGFIGRFGSKAQMASLAGFVRLALRDHLGLSSAIVSEVEIQGELESPVEVANGDDDAVADPELPASDVLDLLAFTAYLAAPQPMPATATTRAGEALFLEVGCGGCHVPTLNGPRGPLPAYTDLLLHDLGPLMADGVAVGEATGSEFRTAPLWGLVGAGPYLHDGRADTLDEAVLWHGGEAEASVRRYRALAMSQRTTLLAFLESRGGLQKEPPSAFERTFDLRSGMGPRFNADSCGACHFQPVMGGAGTADVDVLRQGILSSTGEFRPPPSGSTMLHRHSVDGVRNLPSPETNLIERRQTPSLLGIRLIESIPDAAIAQHADPDDRDGDGIRGRVRVLRDGRIGRFGWKANLATVEDFAVDALENELGLGQEMAGEQVKLELIRFMNELPAPKAGPETPQVFRTLGCASCHVPALPGGGGELVPLFSDLLLHEVAGPQARLVVDEVAGRAFRTPPLWGVSTTPPYWHDGRAETLEAAIEAHDGEAARSRDAFRAAASSKRAALLAFLRSL